MELISLASKNSFGQPVHWTTHLFPIVGIFLYTIYPKSFRLSDFYLKTFSMVHNALLVIFSAWTFGSLSYVLYSSETVISTTHYFQDPFFDKVILMFYISKYYEFFDTILLYMNGKTPIFLQKYHHIGAVIVWHLCYVYKVDAVLISSFVNSFVHTIMYSYYLGCLLKISGVRVIKQFITTLQLVQLCVPSLLVVVLYYPPAETAFNYGIILFFVGYVAVLVGLFGQFYFANYINVKTKNQ